LRNINDLFALSGDTDFKTQTTRHVTSPP
jgi:hypothetical protein